MVPHDSKSDLPLDVGEHRSYRSPAVKPYTAGPGDRILSIKYRVTYVLQTTEMILFRCGILYTYILLYTHDVLLFIWSYFSLDSGLR